MVVGITVCCAQKDKPCAVHVWWLCRIRQRGNRRLHAGRQYRGQPLGQGFCFGVWNVRLIFRAPQDAFDEVKKIKKRGVVA